MNDYPTRPPFFAHRLTRLLFKSCALQELGSHAVLLIIHIAHTEDAARYQGPVKFWNSQLSEVLGFKSPKQLNNARSAAIDAGWLHYERSNDRSVGYYWTKLPDGVKRFDDEPIEPLTLFSESGKHSENGTHCGTRCGTHSGTRRGKPSNPVPDPVPNTATAVAAANGKSRKAKKIKARTYSEKFERFWSVYWNKRNKASAADAFPAAIARIIDDASLPPADDEAAVGWLVSRTRAYHRQRDETADNLHASTYLNQDRFLDELTSTSSGPKTIRFNPEDAL